MLPQSVAHILGLHVVEHFKMPATDFEETIKVYFEIMFLPTELN